MVNQQPIVFVVDDDAAARSSLESLLNSVGLRVQAFTSGMEFLEHSLPDAPCCLVLDVRLPQISGIELQRDLTARGISIPIIFITGHGDIPMSVEAMKAGAMEFLTKPFRGQVLLDAIHKALEHDRSIRREKTRLAELRGRINSLTPREREVLNGVIAGNLNKQIAAALGASERTIKVHRANVMRKMGAASLADLIRMAEKALV
jgi:FixJ family two-component response regulator